MASDLLSIGTSGAQAARAALDVTSQNITNASTDGYVRRSVQLTEVSSASTYGQAGDVSLSGVRVGSVVRNADAFRQSEARRTNSDATRASTQVAGLQNVESAVEQSGAYDAIVTFEGSLQQLTSNPTDSTLRASVVAAAQSMASTMNVASTSLNQAAQGLQFEASAGVSQVNVLAGQLSNVNLALARGSNGTSDQSTLLDQRDSLLQSLSNYVDVTTNIAANGTVEVRVGGASGPQLVSGGTATTLSMATASDGTLSFALGSDPVTPAGGSLAGDAQALGKLKDVRSGLDSVASGVISAVNTAQTNGVALDGSTGTPMFTGTGAADIAVAFSDGSQIATAPAGAGANSRDQSNLTALQSAFSAADPANQTDALLFDISSAVQSATTTSTALSAIASTAQTTLAAQAGVSLDTEAANLVRYQQAFQASGRIIQVAQDTFNTMLAIK